MSITGPFTRLQPPPRDNDPKAWALWYDKLYRILSGLPGIEWGLVSKAGSELDDIEERPHSMLQDVLGWSSGTDVVQDKHISQAEGKKWEDHVNVTDGNPHGTDHAQLDAILGTGAYHISQNENAEITALDGLASGLVAKTGNATYSPRTITGTTDEVTVTNGDGVSGNPVIDLPERISAPRKFGGATDNAEFEADGTLKFNGAATVFEDDNFSGPGTAIGASAPSLVNWDTSTIQIPSFPHNNTKELMMIREYPHKAKQNADFVIHAHVIPTTTDIGTIKLYCEVYVRNDNALKYTTTFSNTVTTTGVAWEELRVNIGTIAASIGVTQGTQIGYRLYRLNTDPGTYSFPACISTWGYHYEIDTIGSRQITAK